jgi:hypothetical protein
MRPSDQAIEQFTREILGCDCPAEVFQYIDCQNGPSLGKNDPRAFRINIGHRLLIYIVECPNRELLAQRIRELAALGKLERDNMNFNRFRLVIRTDEPDAVAVPAQTAFLDSNPDDKLHLHIIHGHDFPA